MGSSLPSLRGQRRTVLSSPAEATQEASGASARQLMPSAWPVKICSSLALTRSQILSVRSLLLDFGLPIRWHRALFVAALALAVLLFVVVWSWRWY